LENGIRADRTNCTANVLERVPAFAGTTTDVAPES